jgi:hypothetical protein
MTKPTTIAFYLPQFYPTPENDAWYGTGFTEWRNVASTKPLFPDHYQPRLPADLGFYDLRLPEIRERQAQMAKAHGIDAFCYYHYWFEGHRPLDLVVDDVIAHGTPDMPFCLAWANENWSRHWDASSHEVLLRQAYSPEDDIEHGKFLLKALQHPLYLKVDGRRVLFIYRVQAMPDAEKTFATWRDIWRAEGVDDVEIITFHTHGLEADPAEFGADSAAEFIPHLIGERGVQPSQPAGMGPGNMAFDYADVVDLYSSYPKPSWRRVECVVPGWDNTARRGDGKSLLLHGSTPELYEKWLRAAVERADGTGMVVINAWNEWAEGAYLEPDLRFGDAYLKATARALGVEQPEEPVRTPLSHVPFDLPGRFADLYLQAVERQITLQRRLSRLEATLDRQVESRVAGITDEMVERRAKELRPPKRRRGAAS